MRKPLASRIAGLAVLYCVVFFILVIMQFSSSGNFSLSYGEMTIRGRYSEASDQEITGGVKIYYGGIEFLLNENGLALSGDDGVVYVNPEYMTMADNTVRFGLSGGTTIEFSSLETQGGRELRIGAEFAENISEVIIPIAPRRSSLVRDNNQLGIIYGGSRYSFTGTGGELEDRKIILSRERTIVLYRSRGEQKVFDPADYIIAQSQNYAVELQRWEDINFNLWNQNASSMQNEDDIIAYCSEALQRGSYLAAVAAIPRNFLDSPGHSYRSSVYVGGMASAYRMFAADEREKQNFYTRLARERSLEILREEHILNFLFTRNNTDLVTDVINIIRGADAENLIPDYCPGLLEAYSDFRQIFPQIENPVEHLTDRIFSLVSENLYRDTEKDTVLASNSDGINPEFSLRLGNALISWAAISGDTEWAAIGRSLVLSALADSGNNAGRFYNALKTGSYYPRAVSLPNTGHWAWTASPSVRTSSSGGNINLAVNFPVGMTHHIIIRGVRPFIKLQIHGVDYRSDSQFERYDSSGWIYYQQDQILIFKLRHRSTVENITIFYRVEEPVETEEAGDTAVS